MVLDSGELGFSLRPTPAPLAHGRQTTVERLGQALIALASSGSHHDPYAQGKRLRTTGLTQQRFKERLLWW